ncbi:MAG: cytoplasmic protein [Thermodesulfobacteriota bacterium]
MKPGHHSHNFVNEYQGLVGFGLDRETDEKSLTVYLQKFSDDTLLKTLLPRLTEDEIQEIFILISRLLKTHLKEEEYHQLFLKEDVTEEGVNGPQG